MDEKTKKTINLFSNRMVADIKEEIENRKKIIAAREAKQKEENEEKEISEKQNKLSANHM